MEELNADEVNIAAQGAGRGQGPDWTERLTLKKVLAVDIFFCDNSQICDFSEIYYRIGQEAKVYMEQNGLSRCRTNHNLGVSVNYLRCCIAVVPLPLSPAGKFSLQ